MMMLSNFLLWIVVLLQGVALVALWRQARGQGLGRLNAFRSVPNEALAVRNPAVPSERPEGTTLLVYMAANCATGRRLIEDVELLARAEGMRLVLARDGQEGAAWLPARSTQKVPPRTARLRKKVEPDLPRAMIIDANGVIAAQAEVGSRADVVQLLASVSLSPALKAPAEDARVAEGHEQAVILEA